MNEIISELNRAETITDALIEKCSRRCIETTNAVDGILKLKDLAASCKTRSDYLNFFKSVLKLNAEEADDGIILHLGKMQCTCPICDKLHIDKSRLCDCTKSHEKTLWSLFFDKEVDIEIVESIHRGGRDCVIKIVV